MVDQEREKSFPKKEPLVRPAQKEAVIPPEVKDWLTQIERGRAPSPLPVTDDQGNPILFSPRKRKVKITLPLERKQLAASLKKSVSEAARWLAEWCYRLIRMNPHKVVFKNESL